MAIIVYEVMLRRAPHQPDFPVIAFRYHADAHAMSDKLNHAYAVLGLGFFVRDLELIEYPEDYHLKEAADRIDAFVKQSILGIGTPAKKVAN